ncbi:MAG TPA: translocation/assembly module TamB domain-containing protein [Candidatus Acidoferrales bacterium]|nr:translocation/assembly module TamB domain-containing protein [Candidatus Acidoferrales bacterium]
MKRWLRRIFLTLFSLLIVLAAALAVIIESGMADRWGKNAIIRQIGQRTGEPVELGAFHIELFRLRAELDNLTVHGKESAGLPPLFLADKIVAGVRIISLLERKIALNSLEIERPSIFIRTDEQGHSNIPAPRASGPRRPWRQELFDLQVASLRVSNGTIEFNNARIPLDAEGRDFQFAMNFRPGAPAKEAYTGQIGWKQMQFAARRYMPFPSDVCAKFTLLRDSMSLDQLQWKTSNTSIEAHAEVKRFQPLDVEFHYRVRVSLPDLRVILRKPEMPDGTVVATLNGSFAGNRLRMTGHYRADDLALHFKWFHKGGIQSTGDLDVANNRLTMPQFEAEAVGGRVKGQLAMDFHGLVFRVTSHMAGASLSQILDAVDNRSLPVNTLHWDGKTSVDSNLTWVRDFKHLTAGGITEWSPPDSLSARDIPVTATIHYDYSMDRRDVKFTPSTISTPQSQVNFSGTLGAEDNALPVTFHTNRVADWDDFITRIRGHGAKHGEITGVADWKGEMTGPLKGPTFAGNFRLRDARYGRLHWDDITGQMSYSPDEFRLNHAVVTRGRSNATVALRLGLDGSWGFPDDGEWSLDAHLDRASTDDLQGLFGTSYPASALVTADFHGGGTRAAPQLSGTFQLKQAQAYGVRFDSAHGQLALKHDQIQITQAEIDRGSARVSGNLLYRPESRTVNFQLSGGAISLAQFPFLQTKSLPIAGSLSFQMTGSGPITSPDAHGTIQLDNLEFGEEVLDSLAGQIDSDGKTAKLDFRSTKTAGKLQGHLELGLSDDYPLAGGMTVKQIDLDPFIIAGLHLSHLTGHSSVDGEFSVKGPLGNPDALAMQANLSRASFDYEYVKLQNEGPVRLSYRRSQVHVDQAAFTGTDSNFHVTGDAGFTGTRALNLNIAGAINLRLAAGLFPQLDARGTAQVNGAISGTFSSPRITGQAKIIDGSAHYGDFPAGLSNMNGDVMFDRNRLIFDNLTAQAGGGDLRISGALDYGEGPMHYEVNAVATRVRIRYPEGLSWLLGGQVRFSGTTSGALLSGNVTVQRLIFSQNADLASLVIASQTTLSGPATTSAYLRNLQFDVEADTAPGARLEWAGAHFSAEGSVHIRGTWEHPIVLGNIHLLAGEMSFRGNNFQLTRGDINFSNPFRFDPVLNVEAETTINPYQITLDFTGPASRMQLAYRSDPPLPASDIISLLALGTPGESGALMSTSSAQSQNFGATAILSEAISSQLGGPIERLFGISHFRVDPFLSSTGAAQSAAARVTIQQQVTRGLSVTYSTNATANQQQVIEVDYAIRRDISIVGLRDINGIFDLSIKFTQHFR